MLRLWYNKIRIWFLSVFTNRVKRISITDARGKEHKVTVEQKMEKVCTHSEIKQIAPTMWVCTECKDNVFFQISYKVQITEEEMTDYIEKLANHLGYDLQEKK